jgi:hypothetical protein
MLVLLGKDQWFGSLPLEFYSPETFGFLSLYGIPHLLLARAGLLWGILYFLKTANVAKTTTLRDGLYVGIFWLVTALAQPLTAVIFGAVLGLYILSLGAWQGWCSIKGGQPNWRKWRNNLTLVLWSAVIPMPFLLYNVIVFNLDPFLRTWTAQNVITSPHPVHYLIAYGLFLPFAVYGGFRMVRRNPWVAWLPISWALAMPVLAYAPYNLQRRLPEGVWVALITLSMYAFSYRSSNQIFGKDKLRTSRQRSRTVFLIIILFILSIPSALLLVFGGIMAVRDVGSPLFRPTDEVLVFEYLAREGAPWSVVLSSYETGNALPAWAPMRVVIGHGPESVGLEDLRKQVASFFDAETSDTQRVELLSEYGIHYVFWGPSERLLGDWNPTNSPYFDILYQSGDFMLFNVRSLSEY